MKEHGPTPEHRVELRLFEHNALFQRLPELLPRLTALAAVATERLRQGRKLLFFGNGGSAADAQHLAAEFVNRFCLERLAYPAIALTTDTSILTAVGNDRSFSEIFSRQIEALGRAGDVAIGISTSGSSPNVLRGLEVARARGLVTALFTGAGGVALSPLVDHLIAVPSSQTPRIQEAHIFLGHVLCELVEAALASTNSVETLDTPLTGDEAPSPVPSRQTTDTSSRDYFVHPTSHVDEGVAIGEGTKIWYFCHVQRGATIGRHCILGQNVNIDRDAVVGDRVKIQNNVSVYKGAVIEDDVFLGPSAVLTNVVNPRSHVSRKHEFRETRIRRGATIGANATLVCGHVIGEYAFVGAGAVVTRDVPDYALVTGNPARVRGFVCQCGIRLPLSGGETSPCSVVCQDCGLAYDFDGLTLSLVPRTDGDEKGSFSPV